MSCFAVRFGLCLIALVGTSVLLTGCKRTDADSMIADKNDTNVKRLATLYSFFHIQNRNKGPKNEEQLRSFIEAQDPKRLKRGGIDITSLDDLFVSERDGEPFVVRYGINTVVRGPSLPVIFESTGIDSMRQVGFFNGSMQEVDEEEYDRLLAGEADKEKVDHGRR